MTSFDPQATHDALAVVGRLGELNFGVSEAEVHCFCYLACAAWVQDRHNEGWGYGFTALNSARPFSSELDIAIRGCRTSGLITRVGEVLALTDSGNGFDHQLRGSVADGGRRPYVLSACELSLAISIPTALAGLALEPQLMRASALASERPLFDEYGTAVMSEEIAELDASLPAGVSLLPRMTFWVSYWAAVGERLDREARLNA